MFKTRASILPGTPSAATYCVNVISSLLMFNVTVPGVNVIDCANINSGTSPLTFVLNVL